MKRIAVHSGTFHLDDALSCYMIKLLPEYKNHTITRTRDETEINESDIVVDVGGIYDHEKKRYDHHQKGFNETYSTEFKTKLCGAGMIYKHYGREILIEILGLQKEEINEYNFKLLQTKVYRDFVEGVDGTDNGIPKFDTEVEQNYSSVNCLPKRIKRLNPSWREPEISSDSLFPQAIELAGKEFVDFVKYLWKNWIPAVDIVHSTIQKTLEQDPKSQILELPSPMPFLEHLYREEKELEIPGQFKYVIFQSTRPNKQGLKEWITRAVSKVNEPFVNRLSLHEDWRGLRNEELQNISKIEGAVFVHSSGFLGASKNHKSALELALKSLEINSNEK
ncbi:protein myg1 [Anaeramoeba flamelloides]|uniref:Protein myg1 n=1 Tax=Anaeramoeba flamelloides TaxID=1746091 RepID=A0AAV7Z865_9EUKA|nr:protein myg1 [Anaeramoeba flamelloides]KAJ6249003.1 protein myg1 [Anaeramoeba flamelloides]